MSEKKILSRAIIAQYVLSRKILLFIGFACLFKCQVIGQETVSKKDGRFTANLENNGVLMNQDPQKLMRSFDLHLQWWTLMGEAVEYYDFTWESTGEFIIDGKTITRAMVAKYPDLLQRFDRVEPYKAWVMVRGTVDAGSLTAKRGSIPSVGGFDLRRGDSFKKNGKSYDRYYLSGEFSYLIDHLKVLQSRAGVKGKGIVPGSPHWNEFIYWENKDYYDTYPRSDKKQEEANKRSFERAQKLSMHATLHKIEWPETELRGIAERYEKYESGELEPTEEGDLDDLLSGAAEDDCGDDIDALLSGCGQGAGEVEFEIKVEDGKQGVVAKDGRILIPFKKWNITSYDAVTGFAEVKKKLGERSKSGSCDKVWEFEIFELSTVDARGDAVIEGKKIAERIPESLGSFVTLGVEYVNETEEERAARKRRIEQRKREEARERRRCNALNEPVYQAFVHKLQSEGIDISRL